MLRWKMQGRGSKNKGREGEKEFAALLAAFGYIAYRDGKQFFTPEGVRIHRDVQHNVPGIHFEVKRREKVDVPAWMRQAKEESGDAVPVVAWRGNRQPWRIIMDADDFLRLIGGLDEDRSDGK